jgi:hypothetical protein
MLATILYRQAGTPETAALENPFRDIPDGAWYSGAAAWASSAGLSEGYGDGTFRPDNNVTRQEFATILNRYNAFFGGNGESAGNAAPERPFADAAYIDAWARDGAEWCAANGIIDGKPGNIFDPAGFATRAESAAMLQRFVENGFGARL